MKKPFKITALILAISIAFAPNISFVAHALCHLIISEHAHGHEENIPENDHLKHHTEHHLLMRNPLSFGIVITNIKYKPSVIKVYDLKRVALSMAQKVSGNQYYSFRIKDSPPSFASFISLALHPINAPPSL